MKKSPANVAFWCLLVALLCGAKETTALDDCYWVELGACMPVLVGSGPLSDGCCVKLKEQVPCLCGYFKDPDVGPVFKKFHFPKVASDCGVTFPTC